MKNLAIKAENISKQYRLGEVGTGTLSHDLNRFWAKVRGKEDPYLKIGDTNDRSVKGVSDYVWSLRDINFEIEKGEAVGIIGRNGAGKSTLLKLLSKVTKPTTGGFKVNGRIASLLEVGTGFNPQMTGRENIYLNGAILGMRRHEISRKFDEIVDFSGVERYIDTPVKRYSSGMYVRLAFAVAAYLESEIMIVDEVLAVGDAEFQKKCLGKMNEVSKGEGRTVLFVSHNLTAVKNLCTRGVYLKNGELAYSGNLETAFEKYLSSGNITSSVDINVRNEDFEVLEVSINDNGSPGHFNIEEELEFTIRVKSYIDFEKININLFFNSLEGALIFATSSAAEPVQKGEYLFTCKVPKGTLNDNAYIVDLMVVKNRSRGLIDVKGFIQIQGVESEKREGAWLNKYPGLIRPTYFDWNRTKL